MKLIFNENHAKQRKEEYDTKMNSIKGKVYKFVDRYIAGPVCMAIVFGYLIGMFYFIHNNIELGMWGTLGALILFFVLQQVFDHKSKAFLKIPLEVVYLNTLLQGGANPTLILKKNEDKDTCLIKLETENDGVRETKEIGKAKIEFCSFADIDEQTLDFTKEVLYVPFVDCEKLFIRATTNNIE